MKISQDVRSNTSRALFRTMLSAALKVILFVSRRLATLLEKQHKDGLYRVCMDRVDDKGSPYLGRGALSRRSRLDGATQHVISASLRQAIL